MTSTRRAHWRSGIAVLAAIGLGAGSHAYLTGLSTASSALEQGRLIAYGLPISAALIYIALQSMWHHDPARDRDKTTEAAFEAVLGWIVLFVVGLHVIVLTGLTLRAGTGLWRSMLIWIGILLVGVGNLLPRLRPNHLIGIRSRRLLGNRHLWMRVNRIAAYLTVAVGTVLVLTAIALPPGAVSMHVVGTSVLAAIVTLAVCYRRESRAHSDLPPAQPASGS